MASKKLTELPSEELLRALFPKKVVTEVKALVEKMVDEHHREVEKAIDRLEGMPCQCLDARGNLAEGRKVKIQCVRCELLDYLR